MAVGRGNPHRPLLRGKEDVLRTIKNLCFIWVGFHQHTFSTIILGTYFLMRPTMLKKGLSENPGDWKDITIGEELPDSKVLMEQGKTGEATTQRDGDNFLTDNIRRQAETAAYWGKKSNNDQTEFVASYAELEKVAYSTLKKLYDYELEVITVNKSRQGKDTAIPLVWMLPSGIQTSLNI
jgi:hypothetical protein